MREAGRDPVVHHAERARVVSTTAPPRTRAEIEQDIRSKRAERELYVSPDGVAKIHEAINELLTEWQDAGTKETAHG